MYWTVNYFNDDWFPDWYWPTVAILWHDLTQIITELHQEQIFDINIITSDIMALIGDNSTPIMVRKGQSLLQNTSTSHFQAHKISKFDAISGKIETTNVEHGKITHKHGKL